MLLLIFVSTVNNRCTWDTIFGDILNPNKKIKEVSRLLNLAGLTINVDKSHFVLRQVKFLGFIISDGVLKVDASKVDGDSSSMSVFGYDVVVSLVHPELRYYCNPTILI